MPTRKRQKIDILYLKPKYLNHTPRHISMFTVHTMAGRSATTKASTLREAVRNLWPFPTVTPDELLYLNFRGSKRFTNLRAYYLRHYNTLYPSTQP